MVIRPEEPQDYRAVEELTREAFWNLFVPGCNEHLVLHKLRQHPDALLELDFVALEGGRIVGHIIYSRASVVDDAGKRSAVVSFGPVSVLPELQGRGIGSALIEHSLNAAARNHAAVLIYGNPAYYRRFGFQGASVHGISRSDGKYAKALLALELHAGALQGVCGRFCESPVFHTDEEELALFEQGFTPKEKRTTDSQREFAILAAALG